LRAIFLVLILSWSAFARAEFSGQLRSTTDDYPAHLGAPTEDVIPYLSVDLNEKLKISKSLRFQARAYGLTNMEARKSPENMYGDLPEGFFEYKISQLKFRAGMDTINWGVVDVNSPSDVVNPTVLFQPLRTFKRGAPMAEVQWAGESFGFHAIYIPVQQRPLLPSPDSRWLPRQFLVNLQADNTRINLPKFIDYNYLPTETLDHALQNNYGLKLNSHVGGLDLQVTHFQGVAPSPKVRARINVTTSPGDPDAEALSPIAIAPVDYLIRTTGFGAVWAREKWIWRAETAYQATVSKDDLLQPWIWTSVLAAETNMDLGSTTVTWLAQYYYAKNPREADNFISSAYRLFDDTAVLGARWAASDMVTITVSGLYEFPQRGLFAQIGFEQKLSDVLKWGLSWKDFSAQRDGLLRTFDKNDHATLDLTYYF
jgi:hypothetical protein